MSNPKKYFEPITPQVNFPDLEEKIIEYWKKNNIFERSVEERDINNSWNFVDGPPFITGLPHYGSLLSSIPKDVFPRYQTMKGKRVRRVWGWDCHGLPAENKVENKLGLKRKKDIEESVGVKKFIDECKLYVKDVSSEWEWYVDHVGRWVDFENAYKTMDKTYMESVMWVFKQMYEKGYIYKGLRVSLYCPHCSTPISNFEVAMDPDNYKEITEPANTYKYKLKGEDVYLLAWSTTPWNKLATPALAVNPDLTYVQVTQGKDQYILAKNTIKILNTDQKFTLVKEFKGSDLVGREFEPHYSFYKIEEGKKAFVVIPGKFVTEEDGTGIVTIAAYGEDDLKAMQENNIQIVLHVDDEGIVLKDSPIGGGQYYLDVNELVNKDLEDRGLMYKEDQYVHTIPTCWRCHTRLFYAPQNAWYVDIQKLKPRLFANNQSVNWFPAHFKDGRFKKSMESAPDWCISRSRYWGSPVPVWECECGERYVPESISELEELSGKKINDLHKPEIDDVLIKCKKCGANARRVAEVLDSWIEAGSAPFAERHFPFEKEQDLNSFFPPDFIVEYTGQIRAWFYVLHVISTAIYDSNAFKNVLVTGVILGTDGRKMSKNYGNYPDPKEMIQKYGGDALRLYLMGSPVMHGEDIKISEDDYRQQVRGTLLILWNVYNYFVTYANVSDWVPGMPKSESDNLLDKWILSLLNNKIKQISESYDSFDTPAAVNCISEFVNELSSWYIRRSRDRDDKSNFYNTCYEVLVTLCKLVAPITPFIAEEMYRNLTKEDSVHLVDWPEFNNSKVDYNLEQEMLAIRKIIEKAHSLRKENQIPVRQPLAEVTSQSDTKFSYGLEHLVLEELNVKNWKHDTKTIFDVKLDTNITPELREEGEMRQIIRQIQDERKKLGTALDEYIDVVLPEWPKQFEEDIKKKTLIKTLSEGEFSVKRLS